MKAGRLQHFLIVGTVFVGLSLITVASDAAPFFEFTGSGQPADFIGGGQSYVRDQTFGTASVNALDRTGDGQTDYLDFFILGNIPGQFVIVTVGTNQLGQNLNPGVYPNAERAPFASAGHPGLQIGVDGRLCNMDTGSFVIYDVAFASGNILDRIDFSFEQHCEGAPPAFIGRFRYDRSAPLRSLVAEVPTLDPAGLIVLAALIAASAAALHRRRTRDSLATDPSPRSPSR